MKLALGTVQFGLPYGIANTSGQVLPQEIAAILATARSNSIDTLDTAIAYGDSEARLGAAGVEGFKLVSKLPKLDNGVQSIEPMVRASLDRLGVDALEGLLLHRSEDLSGPEGVAVFAIMAGLRDRGLVRRIGVSIYDPAELQAIVPRFAIDLVQAPFNAFDQRLVRSGWLERLQHAGVAVHTRSAFLQGLLLMRPDIRPAAFGRWSEQWTAWDNWLAKAGATAIAAALQVPLSQPGIDRVLVGVDSELQLRDILHAAVEIGPTPPASLATDDLDLINPARWNSK
ncbi:aryl-alcohol dehydrogenase-like predicted oxidoreductase [Devosia sp. UYZn731]|uniref:aldo/keto reductase n=1 Tax=Devosia sp. UYZn731 TaxID=3156345 RepID=UPI003396AB68